ncbi:MAG: VPLPA-CTERM sorting domain-containing protein [Mangrovicoccus sp.]
MRKFILLGTTSFLATFAALETHAATFTLSNTYTPLSTSPVSGSFDLTEFMDDLADTGLQADVQSATVAVTGYSAEKLDPTTVTFKSYYFYYVNVPRTGYYSYSCGWSTCTRAYTYYVQTAATGQEYERQTGDMTPDILVADFGDAEITLDTDNPPVPTGSSGSYSTNYFEREYTSYDSGTESGHTSLTEADLADLLDDLVLNYTLTTMGGSYDHVLASLTINYVTSAAPSPVPLPASALLLTGGLSGLSLWRRRQKAKINS